MKLPKFEDIIEAHDRIRAFIHRTPILRSQFFDELLSAEIYFKCENFQKVGAFKFRGATNALLQLDREQLNRGVATHSSGNHAQALALAAHKLGSKATIIMPRTSPKVKSDAVRGYGADIIFCEPTLEARETALNEFVARSGAEFVHPYNNFNIICGQGTAAKELIEDVGELDIVMAPVGGGGLLSGTSISTKSMLPQAKVIAGEPLGADDAARSLREGKIIPSVGPNTIADGLLTSLGELTFAIIKDNTDAILTAEESTIRLVMRYVWERMKIIIEPSSAVPIAAMLENKSLFEGKRVGIILSGGNVDLSKLPFE